MRRYHQDDVIKRKHFPRYWSFVRGIHRSPVNHKDLWRGALMFSLIYIWINVWVNNCEACDLRRHHVHYDVTVMITPNNASDMMSPGTWIWTYKIAPTLATYPVRILLHSTLVNSMNFLVFFVPFLPTANYCIIFYQLPIITYVFFYPQASIYGSCGHTAQWQTVFLTALPIDHTIPSKMTKLFCF